MRSALAGRCNFLSCENIESLELKFGSLSPRLEPDVWLFPAIQTVTAYKEEYQPLDPSEGLRKFLKSLKMVTEDGLTDKRIIWRKESVQA